MSHSLSHYKLVQKACSYTPTNEDSGWKAAVDKEWEKLEHLPSWQVTKSQEQERGH